MRRLENVDTCFEPATTYITVLDTCNKQSGNVAKAIDFAEYISFDKKNEIFEMLGVMPAAYPDKENEDLMAVYEQYNNSRIISKEVENSEILSELEIILRRVWSGENISDVIKEYE